MATSLKLFTFAVLLCVAAAVGRADAIDAWLDDYYAAVSAATKASSAALLAKHPDWRPQLEANANYAAAEEAMYRYLFRYHIEHGTHRLAWENGDWRMSIVVCNCGEEGSVFTREFTELFDRRSRALRDMEQQWSNSFDQQAKAEGFAPYSIGPGAISPQVLALHEGFEALLKQPAIAPLPAPYPHRLYRGFPEINVTNRSGGELKLHCVSDGKSDVLVFKPADETTIVWPDARPVTFTSFETPDGIFELNGMDAAKARELWFVFTSPTHADVYRRSDVYQQGEFFRQVKTPIKAVLTLDAQKRAN